MSVHVRENKEAAGLKQHESDSRKHDKDQSLQEKLQAFEEKLEEEAAQGKAEGDSPGPQRCQSLGQVTREEHRDLRFNRWVDSWSCHIKS